MTVCVLMLNRMVIGVVKLGVIQRRSATYFGYTRTDETTTFCNHTDPLRVLTSVGRSAAYDHWIYQRDGGVNDFQRPSQLRGIGVWFRRGSLKNGYHFQGGQQARKLPSPDSGR